MIPRNRGFKNWTFEFVLFASSVIDYDYIMKLLADYSQGQPSKQKMTRQQLIGLIQSDAKFMDESEDIEAYINTLEEGGGLSEDQIREGYEAFKTERQMQDVSDIADQHGLEVSELQGFIDDILQRMIFDDEKLTRLLSPLELGWKDRNRKKKTMMGNLIPLLQKRSGGLEISGLSAYEH